MPNTLDSEKKPVEVNDLEILGYPIKRIRSVWVHPGGSVTNFVPTSGNQDHSKLIEALRQIYTGKTKIEISVIKPDTNKFNGQIITYGWIKAKDCGASDPGILNLPINTLRKVYILASGGLFENVIASGDEIYNHEKLIERMCRIFRIRKISQANIYAPAVNHELRNKEIVFLDWLSVYSTGF